MPYVLIDPGETLDYTFDWSTWLDDGASPTDTIATSSWSVVPQQASPLAPTLSGERQTASSATVFVTSALYGQVYRLTNRIVTAQGRTAERSVTLQCEHR
jgi:hypothetical protein